MNVDRRSFSLATAAAAAQSALGQDAPKVKTAMIGTGGRGNFLLGGVLEQPNAEVVALCDIKPDRLDKAATRAAKTNPKTYTDWRQIIDRKDIDAVYIATPPYLHSEMAVAALKSGKNVYCEKPIGITPAQVKAVVEAAHASKKVFTAGQQLRSMRIYAEAVKKIHDGIIGDVIMIKAQRHAPSDLPHDGTSRDWYFDVNKGGGYLVEQSVHNLDLCNWAVGRKPERAEGLGATVLYKNDPPGRTIYDSGSLIYDYGNGVRMSFTQNVFHPRNMPGANQYIYVYGSKGAVDLMTPIPTMYPLAQGGQPVPLVEKGQDNQYEHIVRFYKAVQDGGPNPADITIGATAALTAILGHEAMAKEKIVRWDDMGVRL
jgi:myo-inositol 2-dehydrogenase / D-chiro-inositol 1-dehydrogenase